MSRPPNGSGDRADALVVGAGPAGAVTALLLARRGWRVRLLDRARFPRAKACGECLNPGAVATLERLGLAPRVATLKPAELHGWQLATPALRPRTADFPAGTGTGWAVSRGRFDATLVEAAIEAGAELVEEARVVEARPGSQDGPPGVTLSDGRSFEGRVLVGADGLRSVVARSLGTLRRPGRRKASLTLHVTGVRRPPTHGALVLSEGHTLGLAPLDPDGHTWNLTTVVTTERADALPREPADLLAHARRHLDGLEGARASAGPWGSGPFDWPAARRPLPGVFLVGDAAGYYDPLTGQGIYRAMRSAELAAPALDAALGSSGASSTDFSAAVRETAARFRAGRAVQGVVEAALARPRLLDAALRGLGEADGLAHLVAVTGDARHPGSLLRPSLAVALLRGWWRQPGADTVTSR